jgi:hypothetical protein
MGGGIKGVDRKIRTDPAAILGFAMALGRGRETIFLSPDFAAKAPYDGGFQTYQGLTFRYSAMGRYQADE